MKPKILFASPCGPYPKLPLEKDPIDYFYYRNTYKQKMFQLRSFQSWHSLHFLAQNISVPSVVLENPSFKKFKDEINNGEYEIIAIGFTILLTKKVLEMVEWIKQNHPNIEIILGGYGTAIFKESFEISNKLKSLVNHICFGEGLEFINIIIFDKWGINNTKKLSQNFLPAINSFYRTRIEIFKQIVVVGGLGCVYGCSFCATSSQFNKQYISLFTGKELFDCLLEQSKKYPNIQSAIIYEEDFLNHRKKVLEFMEHFSNSELKNRPFLLTVFASLNSILKFQVEELIQCGIGTIFIGVESLNDEVLLKEGLIKRKGEINNIFEKLHSHGINTLGSLVIGWDSQSFENAKTDSEKFVQLNPTFYQVVPLHIVPGTELWEKMKNEKRIADDFKIETDGVYEFNFEAKSFSHPIALDIVNYTYTRLVDEGGPWAFRLFENIIKGYDNLKENSNPIFSNRAQIYKSMIFPVCILAFTSRLFFFGKGFRKRWNCTMKLFLKSSPMLFILSLILLPITFILLASIYAFGNTFYFLNPNGDQPNFVKIIYGG